ncbi:uncharacterized protein RJT21DRAFT_4771 [Scheffersomyces amazonensis]|uniref:uncharacterized protein n=1 Tax=Scheffersomyces amazonensis TaxID=1078765 RepID=UPI00315D8BEA
MFKPSSYIPQWFRRSSSTSSSSNNSINEKDLSEVPRSFTLPSVENNNKLINISMNDNKEDESFVDIQYRQLSYAEVALMAKDNSNNNNKKSIVSESVTTHIKSPKKRTNVNQFNVLSTDDTDDVDDPNDKTYEPFKSDVSYKKSKQYKNKQHDSVQKRKLKKSAHKLSSHA